METVYVYIFTQVGTGNLQCADFISLLIFQSHCQWLNIKVNWHHDVASEYKFGRNNKTNHHVLAPQIARHTVTVTRHGDRLHMLMQVFLNYSPFLATTVWSASAFSSAGGELIKFLQGTKHSSPLPKEERGLGWRNSERTLNMCGSVGELLPPIFYLITAPDFGLKMKG